MTVEKLASMLNAKGKTVSTAESCTGGMIAGRLTDLAGSSAYFKEGYVTYANEAKEKILNVSHDCLEQYGAVSEETCYQMIKGLLMKTGADYGIAVTGIAGPGGGSREKPVGLVYIGYGNLENCHVVKRQFAGERSEVRQQTVDEAIRLLCQELLAEDR